MCCLKHNRSAIFDDGERYGYSESIPLFAIDKRGTGAIFALLERKNRFYLTKKVIINQVDAVADATIEILELLKSMVHSCKVDNGLSSRIMKVLQKCLIQTFTLLIFMLL